jgi:hypothetical protein
LTIARHDFRKRGVSRAENECRGAINKCSFLVPQARAKAKPERNIKAQAEPERPHAYIGGKAFHRNRSAFNHVFPISVIGVNQWCPFSSDVAQ